MDFNFPIIPSQFPGLAGVSGNAFDLQIGQILSAKVVETQVALNTVSLNISGQTIQAQTQTPVNFQPGQAGPWPAGNPQPGQTLQLQVIKLLPVLEFRILPPTTPTTGDQPPARLDDAPTLKLIMPQPQTQAPTQAGQPANSTVNQLARGQTLEAEVIRVAGGKITLQLLPPPTAAGSTAQTLPANRQITLNAGQLLAADAEHPGAASQSQASGPGLSGLTAGSRITLQVLKTGNQPTFAVTLPETAEDSDDRTIRQMFKQLLPIQNPPAMLLNQLNQILPALENNPTISETLKQLAAQILAAIPQLRELSQPLPLKQALAQSGLFLESNLAAQPPVEQPELNLPEDMKFKLLKFVEALKQEIFTQTLEKSDKEAIDILKDLLQKTDGALARLTLDQVGSLPNDDAAKQGWIIELPFFQQQDASSVKLEIQRDSAGGEGAEKNWVVNITIAPPELATIHCRISCYDGAVNTRFWSDGADTVDRIKANLDYLKQQFEKKGLKTGFMEAQQGKPPQTNPVNQPAGNLLSEKV